MEEGRTRLRQAVASWRPGGHGASGEEESREGFKEA
jgi:hypothetical protein